ncbi:hypothetical protein [Paenibacillus sp. NEAU-GSW1]|uniref:hypothetical protein n=1 Tax=Paenibacillus sp. NEAU-GSW1 TaxID=2682486 RepID=UPI0012E1428D|nr:hypothetical protein [Paenibacillus sp. NEAU-GSW1]MUT68665.1 hypothetical protein [Paenibacillus sp. NEAU-GSW1]
MFIRSVTPAARVADRVEPIQAATRYSYYPYRDEKPILPQEQPQLKKQSKRQWNVHQQKPHGPASPYSDSEDRGLHIDFYV